MARWGSFVFGDGTKFGTTGLTVAEQDAWDVYAGESPALPSRTVPVRSGCAEICRFDPDTWTAGTPLPYVAAGATRQASLVGIGFQQETLTFTISNAAAYDADPGLLALVAPGAWLAVSWTVATPTADTTNLGGVFRVTSGGSRSRLAGTGASSFTVQAVDWAQPTLSLQDGGGWINYRALWDDTRLAYIAGGGTQFPSLSVTAPDSATTWGTLTAAVLAARLLYPYTAQVDVPAPWPTAAPVFSGLDPTGQDFYLQVGDPGKPTNGYDWITWLWPHLGGVYLGYVSETGHLALLPGGNRGQDSGCYLTTGTTALGATPLPWTTPLPRTLTRPEATRVQYYLHGPVGIVTPAEGTESTLVFRTGDDTIVHGEARSTHPVFPYDANNPQTLVIVETDAVVQAAGFPTFTDFCQWRLQTALAAADTLTLAVDAAFPPPPLSTLVRVHAPPDVDGWYRLMGYTQPLGAALGSWQLAWWGAA